MLAITGATGFVGRSLSTALARDGVRCRRLGRLASQDVVGVGDLGPTTAWDAALEGADTVIHLAARVHHMHERDADPLPSYRRTTVEGTVHLARRARAVGVKRLVFVSSVKVMGENTAANLRFKPSDVPQPRDPYGLSKLEAERGLWAVAAETGLEVCVVRPPLVYGGDVGANFRALVSLVQRGVPMPLASVRNARSLIAVENLVDLLRRCAEHPGAVGETFLCRDEVEFSTPHLLRAVGRALGVTVRLFPVPVAVLDRAAHLLGQREKIRRLTESLQVDDRLTRSILDWRPPVAAPDALSRAAATWRSLR